MININENQINFIEEYFANQGFLADYFYMNDKECSFTQEPGYKQYWFIERIFELGKKYLILLEQETQTYYKVKVEEIKTKLITVERCHKFVEEVVLNKITWKSENE